MSYAGDLSPRQAWAKIAAGATLVDVRTEAEWEQTGIPVTASATDSRPDPLFIPWTITGRTPNPQFMEQLRERVPAADAELLFLCRSGVRSVAAANAATAAGFTAYNILEGFEGQPDQSGARTVNGWKNSGLPTNHGTH